MEKKYENRAQLLVVLPKSPESSNVSNQAQSLKTNDPFQVTNSPLHHTIADPYQGNRHGAMLQLNSNASHGDGDIDSRSQGTISLFSEPVERPLHTECDLSDMDGKHPSSSHLSGESDSNSKKSLKSSVIVPKQSGQPLTPILPPASASNETDLGQSSIQNQGSMGSLFPSQYPSLPVPVKYLKLNEDDVQSIDCTHKVVVFGAEDVGKTTMINHLLKNPYEDIRELDQQAKRKGVSVMLRNEKLAETIKLDILEVNKHDVNQRKTKAYEQCEVAVVVFDLSKYDSLKEANVWISKIKEHAKGNPIEFLLVGNKNDLNKSDEMIMKGRQLANRIKINYLKTSATNGLAMDELLECVVTLAYDQHIERKTVNSKIKGVEDQHKIKFEEHRKMLEEQQKMIKDQQKVIEEQKKMFQEEKKMFQEEQTKSNDRQKKLEEKQMELEKKMPKSSWFSCSLM